MQIIDTHCHVSRVWYEPVESLLFQMDRNKVERAWLIQIGGEFDNSYQAECVARYPDRLASFVLVDAKRPDAPDTLAGLAAQGAVGVRLGATTRSPGDDPLAIWRKADELGLVVSCQSSAEAAASAEFAALIEALPNLPIVIEHLGGVKHANNPQPPYALAQQVFTLARFPNTSMKIHGLGEFAQRQMPVTSNTFVEPIPPFLQMVYEAWGPSRMMWGSDFPPVSGREGYTLALQRAMAEFAEKSEEEVEQIFGGAARGLWEKTGE